MMLTTPEAVAIESLRDTDPDRGVAAHYGDPAREQRSLATAAAVVDRSHRGVITVTGPDRLTWLHSLTTQHLTELPPMRGTELLVLSPHGHVEHHAAVFDDGTTTFLDVEPGTAPSLVAWLDRMRFLMRVDVADVSDQWAVLTAAGPDVATALSAIAVGPLDEPVVRPVPGPKFAAAEVTVGPTSVTDVAAVPGGGFARRMPHGVDLIVPRDRAVAVADMLALPFAGAWAFDALRVEHRRPRLGWDTDHRTLPAEVGWLAHAVHLNKGCYRGQETVARVHHLGRPPRRLVLLHLDGITTDELPAPGTPVTTREGRAVGSTGTSARHYELGPVALALVRRSTSDDEPLTIGQSAAVINPD